MKLLENKSALITGGSKGIGKSIVEELANHGANVVFTYLSSEEKALALQKQIEEKGVKCLALKCHASDLSQTEQLVQKAKEFLGQIDILVNNAGITRDGLFMRMSEDDWQKVINNNLNSVFNTCKSIVPIMMKQRSGSIINISSIVGLKGNAGQANYAASKAGMLGLTKSLALELGSRGIRANCVAPGFIETDMTGKLDENMKEQWIKFIPLRRAGQPVDVANTVLFLASDLSGYVSGQTLQVDGGLLT